MTPKLLALAKSSEIFVTSSGICRGVGVSSRKGDNFPFWTKNIAHKNKAWALQLRPGGAERGARHQVEHGRPADPIHGVGMRGVHLQRPEQHQPGDLQGRRCPLHPAPRGHEARHRSKLTGTIIKTHFKTLNFSKSLSFLNRNG